MKKIKNLLTIYILFVFTLTSCSSDDNPPSGAKDTGTFTATMDGVAYNTSIVSVNKMQNSIIIEGARFDTHEIIKITVPGTTAGTYTNCIMEYKKIIDGVEYTNANPVTGESNGIVTITSMKDNILSGNFNFTAYKGDTDAGAIVFDSGIFNSIKFYDTGNVTEGYASALLNGHAVFCYYTQISGDGQFYNIAIQGYDFQHIEITLPVNLEAGNIYYMPSYMLSVRVSDNNIANTYSDKGYITILNNSDGLIEGTFYYLGLDWNQNPHQVTSGYFNINVNND